jgi:hypothetical protein
MISAARRFEAQTPTVPIERYRALAAGAADRFSGIAFYRPFPLRLRTAPLASAEISIAVATENLFRLLEIPIAIPAQPSLVLSDAAWRKYFDADPEIVGRTLEVAGQQAVVAAVIPANSWRLPGRAEAWLLQDQAHLDQLPPATAGFVLGRLPDSKTPPGPEWTLVVPHAGQAADRFHVSSLDKRPLLLSYLFMMAVALLVLAATARLALGDYPVNPPLPGIRLRRWVFLAVKIALLLPIVFCCASLVALDLQAQGLLAASVLGLRWAVIDQRRRCPVCLRLLTNPTRIGGPSQTFLEWYGTELICSQGHGLLYVPEIASSCYSIQRWQYLDPSWTSLFS